MKRDRLLQIVVALGAVARLATYLRRPSLSFDESMLSVSIASRSFLGLLRPLDYGQTAPPLYLWLTKAATVVGGGNEFALRALPLIAGLLLPWAVWRLARQFLPEGAALFASLVVALAPGLVQYAVIVKPYAIDALITALLLDAALRVRARDDRRSWIFLVSLGVGSVLLSTPALFVLAAIGTCLAIGKWRTRWGFLVVAAVGWLGAFAVIYSWFYQSRAAGQFMQTFWASDFLVPASFGLHGRAYGVLRNSFVEALLLRPSPASLAAGFTLVGGAGLLWTSLRKGWGTAWLIVGPVVMTVVASSFRRYPFSWRLLQFTVPLAALWIAAGGAWLWEMRTRWRAGSAVTRVFVAVVALALIGVNVTHPYRTPPTRQLIEDWGSRANRQDPVYVFEGAVPAWAYYTADWSHPDSAWFAAVSDVRNTPDADLELERDGRREIIGHFAGIDWVPGGGASQAHPDSTWPGHETHRIKAAGPGNVWLLFTQTYKDEMPQLLRALSDSGLTRVYADSARGAALFEYRNAAAK